MTLSPALKSTPHKVPELKIIPMTMHLISDELISEITVYSYSRLNILQNDSLKYPLRGKNYSFINMEYCLGPTLLKEKYFY
jgi:hypothetical protein